MVRSMGPSRGSANKRGLRFESTSADKRWMDSSSEAHTARTSSGRSRERGQALVEFALIAPLFLLIVVGIIQFGIGLNYWLDLNRIANQGARWAVVDKYPDCPPPDSGCTLEQHLESQAVSGGLDPDVLICFEESATGAVGEALTVTARHEFNFLAIMDLAPITLRGKATMRIEQTPDLIDSQGVNQCT
jgi:TadE-like protein